VAAPPTSPPRCPPIEIPGITNVIARLSRITGPMPDAIGSTPRSRWSTNAAPIRPNTAPDAPTVTEFGLSSSTPSDPHSRDAKYRPRKRACPSAGSSIVPSQYRMYMLKRMWITPACMKPAVTSRHQSPAATAGPYSPRSAATEPLGPPANELPPAVEPTNSSTLIAIRT
jgi:hypothetical protein